MSGLGIQGSAQSEEEFLIRKLMCAVDLARNLTWHEIDGVRRIIEIIFTSENLNEETGFSISMKRSFIYQLIDPFDLLEISDEFTLT